MAKVFDVIKKDDEYHIVTQTEGGAISETMPLRKFVEETRMIASDGEMITIAQFIDREVARILDHAKVVDGS